MYNKIFFIAIIISLLLHIWAINIFSIIADKWNYQEEKKEILISARMEFFVSNSSYQSVEENINQPLKDDRVISELAPDEKEMVEQAEFQPINGRREQDQNVEDNLLERKETAKEEAIPQKNEPKEQCDEPILQDKDSIREVENIQQVADNILSEKKDEKQIREKEKTERGKDKTQSNANFQQSDREEDNGDIVDENNPAPKDEMQTKSVQEAPLDLTNANLGDSQISLPKIISFNPPDYPDKLRRREIEGQVQLKVLISKEGKVVQAQIYISSGYQDFDQAALESVLKWKFKAAQFDNKKRDSWVFIPVVFKLE